MDVVVPQLAGRQRSLLFGGALGQPAAEGEACGCRAHGVHPQLVVHGVGVPAHTQLQVTVDVEQRTYGQLGRRYLVGYQRIELVEHDGVLALCEPVRQSAAAGDGHMVEVEALGEHVAHLLQVASAAGQLEAEDIHVVALLLGGEATGHTRPILMSATGGRRVVQEVGDDEDELQTAAVYLLHVVGQVV